MSTLKLALLVAGTLIIAAVALGGIYQAAPAGGMVYIINRFTGSARICGTAWCRSLAPGQAAGDPSHD